MAQRVERRAAFSRKEREISSVKVPFQVKALKVLYRRSKSRSKIEGELRSSATNSNPIQKGIEPLHLGKGWPRSQRKDK